MIKYKDNKRNHVIMPGRETELEKFLNSSYKGINHKLKNSYSSNSEDALTWSCFDVISQLPDLKKINALDEIIEHSFCGNDMNQKMPFSFTNEDEIEVEVGKTYKGHSTKEETELDASIETKEKIIFIEAKLYSSISLKDNSKPYDQIAKKNKSWIGLCPERKKGILFYLLRYCTKR